jgi:N-acetylmuramoyl-L-alanine amidase
MKEKILLLFYIILGSYVIKGSYTNNSDSLIYKKIVVIDAGHGGEDTGAVGKHSKEKDIVLSIALKVGKYIEQNMPDVKVIYTRKTDIFIPLHERAMVANNNNADLFVSIHANSNPNTKPYGTETFAMGLHKTKGNLEVAKKENSVIVFEKDYSTKYEGFDPNSAESYIVFSLMQNAYLKQSLELASYVQNEFKNRAKRKDRGVKQAGFLVLWHTSMPSVLIETGFVSNEKEEAYLMSRQGQDYLASAIYRAIKKYLSNINDDNEDTNLSNNTLKTSSDSSFVDIKKAAKDNEIFFRVQITSSSKPLQNNHPVFSNYKDVYEYTENNIYKYTVGKYTSYAEVKEFKNSLKKDFPGAFIVAFKNNKRIKLSEAIKLLN